MGGIGKTTLARVLYERFRANFEIDCFLDNVTEVSKRCGVVHLQKKLLSHRKLGKFQIDDIYEGKNIIRSILRKRRVILVLDDVSDRSHLENLGGNQVWFGQGSTVIITTRDLHLLEAHGIRETYKIECLNTTESLQLFCRKTFGSDQPEEGYLELSKIAVQYAGGLPLALSVLGSFLCGRNFYEWLEALDEMKQVPPNDILKTLRISYDGLEDSEKIIFLDIACFFKGMKKDDVTKILKNCGLNATIGIKVLIEKSLLTSNGWSLEMHDLLQKMGRKIVSQESPNDIGRRSRFWSIEDIDHVLGDKRGTRFIQGIVLESSPEPYEAYSDPEAFSNMRNLKLLMISKVHLLAGLTYLPNSLKVLAWDGYPLEALPLGKQVELVDLKMHHSKIIQPWDDTQFFRKLKSIDLCHSKDLTQTPIVSGAPHLEQLILEGCTNLVEVHQSVGQHKKLVELNMKNCINLKIFPSKLEMVSLKDFILSGCSKVEKLPEFGENMKCLVILDLKDCKNLLCLPSTICNLKSLEILNISGCSKFSRLPNNMEEAQPLEELDVSVTAVRDITPFNPVPMHMIFTTISHLPVLKKLDLSYCNLGDGSIPYDFSGFSSLWSLSLNGNNFSYLPANFITNLSKLRLLELNHCARLQMLPIPPQYLRQLSARECASLEPLFDPLQLWNFLALDDDKMESSAHLHSIVTGSEIPPWFEYQNYVLLDREFAHIGVDSFISIRVHIPYHYRSSEWWRIDACLVLEYVTSNPLEDTLVSICWMVLATEPSFPSFRDAVYMSASQFHTPHLIITSLRGLQEQLRGDSDQLEIRCFTKTYLEHSKVKIRKCGCHVYCKEDVELWHKTKIYIDNIPSTSTSSSPSTVGISLIIPPTPAGSANQEQKSDDAMSPRETFPQPQLEISNDHILENIDDAMNSRETSLQPLLLMSKDHILDNEKENIDDAMNSRETSLQPQLLTSKDHILDDEKGNTSDDATSPRETLPKPQLEISNEHILENEKKKTLFTENIPPTPADSTNYLRSGDVINSRHNESSSVHPNSSMSETSITSLRFRNKTCMCDRRAALKVSHAGKSYYVCDDNKCNYVELWCPEDCVFTSKYQSFESSQELRILLLTNFILSLCVLIFLFFILFFGK